MSVEALNLVRAHRFGSANRKLLMYVLADYAAADWSTYVGQARLAAESELGERTIRRLVGALERDGLLRLEPRYGKSRGRRTDRLVLVRDAIAHLPVSVAARSASIYRPTTTDLPANDDRSTGHAEAARVEPTVNLREPSRVTTGRSNGHAATPTCFLEGNAELYRAHQSEHYVFGHGQPGCRRCEADARATTPPPAIAAAP